LASPSLAEAINPLLSYGLFRDGDCRSGGNDYYNIRMENLLPILSSRPLLTIGGTTRNDVSTDIISIVFTEQMGKLEITLNNWLAPAFKYSDSTLLMPGTQIALFIGPAEAGAVPLFSGNIVTFAPVFPDGGTPTITLVGTHGNPVASQAAIAVQWGRDLREFLPILEGRAIRCTGKTDGNSALRKGTSLTVSGVGTAFSRKYTVSSTIHTFDLANGYRTQFSASS